MPKLLYCLAQGLAKLDRSEVAAAALDPTGLAGCFVMGKVVAGFWKEWRGERKQEELHAEVVEVARLEHAKLAAAVAEALDLPHLDPDRKKLIETVLTLTPAVVRRTLTRPEDPSGKSVPHGLRLDTLDDLARLLPATLPRFHAGDAVPNLGDWELVRLLGAGGFGEVWLARNPLSPRFVGAVKFFFGALAEHVRHEANLVARLTDEAEHPNIVPLRNSSLRGDTPWLLYEYVEGTTLRHQREGDLPSSCGIGYKVCLTEEALCPQSPTKSSRRSDSRPRCSPGTSGGASRPRSPCSTAAGRPAAPSPPSAGGGTPSRPA